MNIIDELAGQLTILRIDDTEVLYINAPVKDLSGLATGIIKSNGLLGEIQEADKYHITLAIFPNFPDSAISEFLQLSLPIRFNVTATKIGTFPDAPSKPIFLEIDPDPALVRLQSDIYNLGTRMGLQLPDNDHFKAELWNPHITLALDVDNIPDQFKSINPVKLRIDKFELQREGYDHVVEMHLPGSIKDRPFVTVRSNVQMRHMKHIGQEGKEATYPGFAHGQSARVVSRTLDVSEEEFMQLLKGDCIVIGPMRRMITIEDGPFAIRHGNNIGQEGVGGQTGGSKPGFPHAEDNGIVIDSKSKDGVIAMPRERVEPKEEAVEKKSLLAEIRRSLDSLLEAIADQYSDVA